MVRCLCLPNATLRDCRSAFAPPLCVICIALSNHQQPGTIPNETPHQISITLNNLEQPAARLATTRQSSATLHHQHNCVSFGQVEIAPAADQAEGVYKVVCTAYTMGAYVVHLMFGDTEVSLYPFEVVPTEVAPPSHARSAGPGPKGAGTFRPKPEASIRCPRTCSVHRDREKGYLRHKRAEGE